MPTIVTRTPVFKHLKSNYTVHGDPPVILIADQMLSVNDVYEALKSTEHYSCATARQVAKATPQSINETVARLLKCSNSQ